MSGEITSPWSIPSIACNSSLRPYLVMTFIFLCWNKLIIKSMARGGRRILFNAWRNGTMPIESKALLISWKATHSVFLLFFASSMTLCNTWMGVFVWPPGSPPKFGPLKMLCSRHIRVSLVLITRTVSFRRHSRRMIGCVFSKLNSQSVGFGIENIWDVFQSVGMSAVEYNLPAKERSNSWTDGCNFLISK